MDDDSNHDYEWRRLEEFLIPLIDDVVRFGELAAAGGDDKERTALGYKIKQSLPESIWVYMSVFRRTIPGHILSADRRKVCDALITNERDTVVARLATDSKLKEICDEMLAQAECIPSHAAVTGKSAEYEALLLIYNTLENKCRPLYADMVLESTLDAARRSSRRGMLALGLSMMAGSAIGIATIIANGGLKKPDSTKGKAPSAASAPLDTPRNSSAVEKLNTRRVRPNDDTPTRE